MKKAWFSLFILFLAGLIVWFVVYDLNRPKELEVIFFNVGQGDSIYIEALTDKQILIDGGPSSVILEKLSEEMPFYDRTIELMVLTHPDHDHLFGLIEVLRNYKVENILQTGAEKETKEYEAWKEMIKKEGANILKARKGQTIFFKGALLKVLHPSEKLDNSINDTSIVLKLLHGSNSFLFTGDITEKTEKKLGDADSDVLKAAHHGSKTSSCPEFLEKVSPSLAVISVGENSYGHPDKGVLARLEEFGIQVKRTDKDNDIGIISTGDNFYFKNK